MKHKYNVGDVILVKRGRYLLEKPIVAVIVGLSEHITIECGYKTIFAGKEKGFYYVVEEDIQEKLE